MHNLLLVFFPNATCLESSYLQNVIVVPVNYLASLFSFSREAMMQLFGSGILSVRNVLPHWEKIIFQLWLPWQYTKIKVSYLVLEETG